jgi:GH35 family endo-1,4-beta-xylanase
MSLEGHRLVYLRAFHKWINERGGKSEKEVFTEFLKYIKNQLKISVVFDVDIIEVIFESIDESKTKKIDESY